MLMTTLNLKTHTKYTQRQHNILDKIFRSTAAKICIDVLFQLNTDDIPLLHHLITPTNRNVLQIRILIRIKNWHMLLNQLITPIITSHKYNVIFYLHH